LLNQASAKKSLTIFLKNIKLILREFSFYF
jgi:hypothetical protein